MNKKYCLWFPLKPGIITKLLIGYTHYNRPTPLPHHARTPPQKKILPLVSPTPHLIMDSHQKIVSFSCRFFFLPAIGHVRGPPVTCHWPLSWPYNGPIWGLLHAITPNMVFNKYFMLFLQETSHIILIWFNVYILLIFTMVFMKLYHWEGKTNEGTLYAWSKRPPSLKMTFSGKGVHFCKPSYFMFKSSISRKKLHSKFVLGLNWIIIIKLPIV